MPDTPTAAQRWRAAADQALADANAYEQARAPMLAAVSDPQLQMVLTSALMDAGQLRRRDAETYARFAQEG